MENSQTCSSQDKRTRIAIVGTVGAKDLLLFEFNALREQILKELKETAEIVESPSGQRYLKIEREWGGAIHYLVRGLKIFRKNNCEPLTSILSVVGNSRNVNEIIEEISSSDIRYCFFVNQNIGCPIFCGIVFNNGDRYWSNNNIYLGAANEIKNFDVLDELQDPDLVIFVTQPIEGLIEILRKGKFKRIALQLFENDLPYLLSREDAKQYLKEIIASHCVLLNLNESELFLASHIFLNEKLELYKDQSSLEIASLADRIIDRFVVAFPNCLFVIGLGALGMTLALSVEKRVVKMCIPAILLEGSFDVGAGDIALASLLHEMLRNSKRNNDYSFDFPVLYSEWNEPIFIELAKAFILGGTLGVYFPNIFNAPPDSALLKKKLLTWKSEINNFPVFNNVYSLVSRFLEGNPNYSWSPIQYADKKTRNNSEYDYLISTAFSKHLNHS